MLLFATSDSTDTETVPSIVIHKFGLFHFDWFVQFVTIQINSIHIRFLLIEKSNPSRRHFSFPVFAEYSHLLTLSLAVRVDNMEI